MSYPFATLWLLSLLITSAILSMSPCSAWAQSKINYKVIPNLEAMKDQAPTPEFTLPNPESFVEGFSRQIGFFEFLGHMVRPVSRRDASNGEALPGV
jgi:hypothetical protein